MVTIRSPEEVAEEARAYENEADVLMDEIPDVAPLDLARELVAKRETCGMDPAAVPFVAEALRGRQSDWLRGRRWSVTASIPGRQELQRTSDHAQAVPQEGSSLD